MLAEDHNLPAAEIVLTKKGKPILASRHNQHLDFSITHDGPWVAVGITEHGRIGIDVSEIKNFQKWGEFANEYLHPSEAFQLRELCSAEATIAAARFWTLKESILKATGHGLELDPRMIAFKLATEPIIQQLPADLPSPDLFHLEEHQLLGGSRLAIANLSDKFECIAPCIIEELCMDALMPKNGREQHPAYKEA